MAYRRSLTTRVAHLTKRFNPSFSYILHDDDDIKRQSSIADSCRPRSNVFLYQHYHNYDINRTTSGLDALFRHRGLSSFSRPIGIGSSFCSYFSSTAAEGSDISEYTSDMAETILDNSVEMVASQASVVSEVAVAAADSYYPVAALQYFIDGIHSFTGLNWWASIALTTILIRGLTIPILINQLKCTTKLTLIRPRMEEIKKKMEDNAHDRTAVNDASRQMKELFKEYGVTPFAPLKGLFVQGPIFISFYLAITNMADKVPSFKEGGAFWFTDLSTPDSLYIFPILTGLSFLATVECNVQEGLEGNPIAGSIKNFSRGLAVFAVPFTITFPKAIFCYWITSNLFSLVYGSVIKQTKIKKLLNIPIIPPAPSGTPPPAPSLLSTSTPPKPVTQELPSPSTITDQNRSSSSVISQRLGVLEKQLKGTKKNKKKRVI